jgi:superfamily II DNA helicase RecQ
VVHTDNPQEIHSFKLIRNFIVQAEALNQRTGRLAELFDSKTFRRNMALFVVDEAHKIDRWGRSHYGVEAFKPAWSQLGSNRMRLFSNPRTLALTATAPPIMIPHIINSLQLHPNKHSVITRQLNHPNICYAACPLIGSITNMHNYDFIIPTPHHIPPSSILFCDNKDLVLAIAFHLASRLDPSLHPRKLIRPYHGDYSDEYRKDTWQSYKQGNCRILVATSSAGTVSNTAHILYDFC